MADPDTTGFLALATHARRAGRLAARGTVAVRAPVARRRLPSAYEIARLKLGASTSGLRLSIAHSSKADIDGSRDEETQFPH